MLEDHPVLFRCIDPHQACARKICRPGIQICCARHSFAARDHQKLPVSPFIRICLPYRQHGTVVLLVTGIRHLILLSKLFCMYPHIRRMYPSCILTARIEYKSQFFQLERYREIRLKGFPQHAARIRRYPRRQVNGEFDRLCFIHLPQHICVFPRDLAAKTHTKDCVYDDTIFIFYIFVAYFAADFLKPFDLLPCLLCTMGFIAYKTDPCMISFSKEKPCDRKPVSSVIPGTAHNTGLRKIEPLFFHHLYAGPGSALHQLKRRDTCLMYRILVRPLHLRAVCQISHLPHLLSLAVKRTCNPACTYMLLLHALILAIICVLRYTG